MLQKNQSAKILFHISSTSLMRTKYIERDAKKPKKGEEI